MNESNRELLILKEYLDQKVDQFERLDFIDSDPIAIVHGFEDPKDQEIIGLFCALLAWGRRDVLLGKLAELCERMAYRPFEFVRSFNSSRDAERLSGFYHRTFRDSDAIAMCENLCWTLDRFGSIEELCSSFLSNADPHVGPAIQGLSETLTEEGPAPSPRLRKHFARPSGGSAAKRLSMYFRWMVRPGPVDLGIWAHIRSDQLVLPLDVHSGRQARAVGLLTRKANDWKAVLELTDYCKLLNPSDPARYDYAFFGTGVAGEALHCPTQSHDSL